MKQHIPAGKRCGDMGSIAVCSALEEVFAQLVNEAGRRSCLDEGIDYEKYMAQFDAEDGPDLDNKQYVRTEYAFNL